MRSYDDILDKLKRDYTTLTGTQPDKASDIGVRLAVLSGELFSLYAQLNWLQNQMFPTTATGEYLELHAAQRGLERKNGTKAVGEVDFRIGHIVSHNILIPQGTVVSTSEGDPVRFETTHDTTLFAGHYSAHAHIIALEEGERGNVSEQTISVIVTPVSGITDVQNDYRTEQGSDVESDDALRKRLLDSFIRPPNGTNSAYYRNEALAVEGVAAAGVIPRNRGQGTVDVYVMNVIGEAPPLLLQRVRERLESAREINVDVQVLPMTVVSCNVYLEMSVIKGYDFDVVSERCKNEIRFYFHYLGGGEKVYLSEIGKAVGSVEGVKDFTFTGQLMHDVTIPTNCAARCGSILITERE